MRDQRFCNWAVTVSIERINPSWHALEFSTPFFTERAAWGVWVLVYRTLRLVAWVWSQIEKVKK